MLPELIRWKLHCLSAPFNTMKRKVVILIFLCVFLVCTSLEPAQFKSEEVSLRIFPLTIYFSPADPDLAPLVLSDSPIVVEIKIDSAHEWKLTVVAYGDLEGERGISIPIQNISWTATPSPPFLNGALAKKKPQLVATGSGESDLRGELNFSLQNTWEYLAGEYSQTISFTLTVL